MMPSRSRTPGVVMMALSLGFAVGLSFYAVTISPPGIKTVASVVFVVMVVVTTFTLAGMIAMRFAVNAAEGGDDETVR